MYVYAQTAFPIHLLLFFFGLAKQTITNLTYEPTSAGAAAVSAHQKKKPRSNRGIYFRGGGKGGKSEQRAHERYITTARSIINLFRANELQQRKLDSLCTCPVKRSTPQQQCEHPSPSLFSRTYNISWYMLPLLHPSLLNLLYFLLVLDTCGRTGDQVFWYTN